MKMMKMMKILFITQFFPPETGAAASRISGLAKNLNRLGHKITVLTGLPNYPSGIINERYRSKLFCLENIDGVAINRVWVYASPLRSFFTRLLNYFSLVITSILFELFDKDNYDVLVASSPPLFLGISGYVIARLKRARFVLDIRDIWPKIGIDTGELNKDSIFIRIAEGLEAFLYNKADLITVVTGYKFRHLKEKGMPESKIKMIPNGVDREFIEVKTDPEVKAKYYNNSGTFTVLYAGLLGIAQGVEVVIKAANLLKDRHEIKFYIIGEGVEKGSLVRLAKGLGLQNVIFIDNQPKEKIATFLRHSDVSIIPLKKADFADSVPSKLLESMAFGCPVILSASGEAAMIVERSGGGLVARPGDPLELAEAISRLYNDPDLRIQSGRNGIRFIEDNFIREKIAKELEKALIYITT